MMAQFLGDLFPPRPVTEDELRDLRSEPNCLLSAIGLFGLKPDPEESIVAVKIFAADETSTNPVPPELCRRSDNLRRIGRHLRGRGALLGVPGMAWSDTEYYLLYDRRTKTWTPIVEPVTVTDFRASTALRNRFTAQAAAAYIDAPLVPLHGWRSEDDLLRGMLPTQPLMSTTLDALEARPPVLGAVPIARLRESKGIVALALGSSWTPRSGGDALIGFLGYIPRASLWDVIRDTPRANREESGETWKLRYSVATHRSPIEKDWQRIEFGRELLLNYLHDQYERDCIVLTEGAIAPPRTLDRQISGIADVEVESYYDTTGANV